MEQPNKRSISKSIYLGGMLIILGPLLGYLLCLIYAVLIRLFYSSGQGSTDAAQFFLSGCIFAFIALGLSFILIGCTERIINSRNSN